MDNDIRTRINELEKKQRFESDADVIREIYRYKKERKEIKGIPEHIYLEKNKGSFSQTFNGTRKFKEEDYLAIEYVLDTSMAYIIEGKGEISGSFKPIGIRCAAFTDTIGNYEELMRDDVINNTDEYNKTLLDYMIQYKSKNGFIFFAERDLLPLEKTGSQNLISNCLHYFKDNTELLKILCEVLPIKLLIKYFDGFVSFREIQFEQFDGRHNTSFSDDVLTEAIKREDLRKELAKTKEENIDSLCNGAKRNNGKPYGNGLFVNYGLTRMLRYALTHDVSDEIRIELLESSLAVNKKSFESASTFEEDEIKIDKYGFLMDKHDYICFGSVVVPFEATVELSDKSKELLEQLNRQVHDFHEFICYHSKISTYANEIYADKKTNTAYYDFFKLMNGADIKTIPLYKGNTSNGKDLFKVSNSERSRPANGTDETLRELIKAIKEIDIISWSKLNGQTYYMVDPSIYMLNGEVNFIMPKDITLSYKYSNLIRLINNNAMWHLYDPNNKIKIKRFVGLLRAYGIEKDDLEVFIEQFKVASEENAKSVDKSNDRGKELALKSLENKSLIEIYKDIIIKEF